MAFRAQTPAAGGASLRITLLSILSALLCITNCMAASAPPAPVDVDSLRPAQEVTRAIVPVFAPSGDAGTAQGPRLRTLAIDDPFDGWAMLSLHNPGTEKLDRLLVFSYPALRRSGFWGALPTAGR